MGGMEYRRDINGRSDLDWFGQLIVVFHVTHVSLIFMFFHPKHSTAVFLPTRSKIHCLPLIHMTHGRHLQKDWLKNVHFLVYRAEVEVAETT